MGCISLLLPCVLASQGAEDLERQARQCAEEQLAVVTARLAIAEEAASCNRREADAARERGGELVRQLEQLKAAHSCEVEGLKAQLSEVSAMKCVKVYRSGWACGGWAMEATCAWANLLAAQLLL